HPHFVGVVFGISVFAQLPVGAPAGVGTINRVDHALIFADMIAVVINADEVAVFIEHKFMGVAQPGGKDFKIAAIGFAAHDHALVGVMPFFAVGVGNTHTDITDTVIYAPVRPHHDARHIVAAETDMYAKAV